MIIEYKNKTDNECYFEFNPVRFAVNSNKTQVKQLFNRVVKNSLQPWNTASRILLELLNEKQLAGEYFKYNYYSTGSEKKQREKSIKVLEFMEEYTRQFISKYDF